MAKILLSTLQLPAGPIGPEGPAGPPGERGLDGANVLPTSEAVAQAVTEPGPAKDALSATIAEATFTVNLEDFDPDANFSVALANAIDAAENGGVILLKPGKTYYSRGSVLRTDKHVRIRCNGARILRASDSANVSLLELKYTFANVASVVALSDVSYDWGGLSSFSTLVTRIELASTAGWAPGDVCKVFSDDPIPWSVASQNERIADTFEVLAVVGNYIYAPVTLRPGIAAFTTNVRVAKMTRRDVVLDDLWVEDQAGSPATRSKPAVLIQGAVGPRLVRPRAENLLAEGFQLTSPFNSEVVDPVGRNIRTSLEYNTFGYAVRENGPVGSRIIGGRGTNLRHIYTSGAFDNVPANSAEIWRYGGAIDVVQAAGIAGQVGHSAFDLHDEALNAAIIDATVRFNHREPEGSQAAAKLRGKGHVVKGLTTIGPGGLVEEGQTGGTEHVIAGHTHQGVPGVSGSAFQARNSPMSGRGEGVYSGFTVWRKYAGEMYRFVKDDRFIPSLYTRMQADGGAARLMYLRDSRVEIGELYVDVRGSTGASNTPQEVRLFFLTDALSEVVAHRVVVRAGGVPWRVGDLSSLDGKVRVASLETDTLPSAFQGGFVSVGSGAEYWVDDVRLNLELLKTGVDTRGNAALTVGSLHRGTQRLTAALTADRLVTEPTLGLPPGKEFTYERSAAATGAFSWTIGGDALTAPGTWLRRKFDRSAGTWSTVARGSM